GLPRPSCWQTKAPVRHMHRLKLSARSSVHHVALIFFAFRNHLPVCRSVAMKCRLVLFGLLCGFGILSQLAAQDTQENDKDKRGPEKGDITAKVREVNSDKYAAPPTQFRPGKVDPKPFDAKAIKKTDTGFVIQMPSGAPIPTPTVYKDKIYVSGGFSTREYFCFDAAN